MNIKSSIIVFVLLVFIQKMNGQYKSEKIKRTIIEMDVPSNFKGGILLPNSAEKYRDSIEARYLNLDSFLIQPEWRLAKAKIVNKTVKWVFYMAGPSIVRSAFFEHTRFINPGDSIRIIFDEGKPVVFGKGAGEFELQLELDALHALAKRPTARPFSINSMNDYFEWIKLINHQLAIVVPLVESYKMKITSRAYNFIKSVAIYGLENQRNNAFVGLNTFLNSKSSNTSADLCAIWDSTQSKTVYGKWLRSSSDYYGDILYFYSFNANEIRRKFKFDFKADTLKSKRLRVSAYYNSAKNNYKGLIREKLMYYIITEEIIKELGPNNDLTLLLLDDYYKQNGFDIYKEAMKEYHAKAMDFTDGKRAPLFELIDSRGKAFTNENFKNKIALLDFWFTGCTGCVQMAPVLRKVEEYFKKDTNVVFISVSTDRQYLQWKKSISNGKYTTGSAINVYTGGSGSDHAIIRDYRIQEYPTIYVLNENGRFMTDQLEDPRKDDGKSLIDLINDRSRLMDQKKVFSQNDGPYIFYNTDSLVVYSINNSHLKKSKFPGTERYAFAAATSEAGKSFQFNLKTNLIAETSEYDRPQKIFALSDIEGNFKALKNLLISGKVIDENFNWIFGTGHLVFVGDMFDRGLQVTECLWLLYSLEQKAKEVGGYVHFILGNHEIMNLSGNMDYVRNKYDDVSHMIGKEYKQLFDSDTELGRWLRSKNIMEKVGDILFVHAGISPEVARMPLSIIEMNNIARPFYGKRLDSTNQYLLTLFDDQRIPGGRDRTSPFWFRGYYGDLDNSRHIPTMAQIDSTLQKFGVSHIVTGHTIVSDKVSVRYDNKVINVDTKHAEGQSEALLIEGDQFYRVNDKGERQLLFVDDKKNASIKQSSSSSTRSN